MTADLFISYAWSSDHHREWVRLLAAQMKAIGFDVLIDQSVDYGDSLSGFMRRVSDSRRVLLIVDENYVHRADNVPGSGVAIENQWISSAFPGKPSGWLSVVYKDNPDFKLPGWLAPHMPRGHVFDSVPGSDDFPGSEQVEELWRWVEGLPAARDHSRSVAVLRERAKRLETIDVQRDPSTWSNPGLSGEVHFEFEKAPRQTFSLGLGEYGFGLCVSGHSVSTVYVLRDPIHAVGINRSKATGLAELAEQLTPGRSVVAAVGEQVILQNELGTLCLVNFLEVQQEVTTPAFKPAHVRFRFEILTSS